jgi:hypothetical protein
MIREQFADALGADRACATLLVGTPSDWDLLPRQSH